ncbi:MAG: sigma-70 family RNA polymerase sigma factor [Clostridia bacterium]|nr:sigma-70 family RNA polymerase sigma factor [Clostridia bacterium]
MEDRQIIDLFWARAERAITETDIKYGDLCKRLADNILNNGEDTRECVNDAYLTVWNLIPPERPTYFKAFLCKIVKNTALNMAKNRSRQKRNPGATASFDALEDCVPSAFTVETEIDAKALGDAISDFLLTQKALHRKIFVCRYWYCDSVKQIAKDFDLTEPVVKVTLYRTKNKLKKYLEKEGYTI